MEAVERYGVVRGGGMAAWRLLRCHPLAKGGLDLVVGPTLPQSARKDGAPGGLDLAVNNHKRGQECPRHTEPIAS
jgi:hypothetical protein